MQRLLSTAVWDENGVRDAVRRLVVDTLGCEHGIIAIDETSFLKHGEQLAGVARQYCGTTGRVENCQVGVFLSWITPRGHAFIDRELYLPTCLTDDRQRCQKAGVPDSVPFRTKPELAIQMLSRLHEAHFQVDWVVADSVYGGNATLREWWASSMSCLGMPLQKQFVTLEKCQCASRVQQPEIPLGGLFSLDSNDISDISSPF